MVAYKAVEPSAEDVESTTNGKSQKLQKEVKKRSLLIKFQRESKFCPRSQMARTLDDYYWTLIGAGSNPTRGEIFF